MGRPNGLSRISRKPLGYWHRTVQKTEQPVLAATSLWPLTPPLLSREGGFRRRAALLVSCETNWTLGDQVVGQSLDVLDECASFIH